MDKRALSAVPRPALTDKNKEMLLLVPRMCYLATADRLEINGVDTLIINFFHAEEAELKPAFRTFCQMDDYITQDLTTDKIKWKTGAINYLTGYLCWYGNSGNIVLASVRERSQILGFLRDFRKKNGISGHETVIPKGAAVDSEIERRIDEYQDTIKKWKLQKKHREEKAEIDLQMQKFGGLPADYGQFVKDAVFENENYIFYSRAKARAYCTKCGHEFEIRKDGLYHKKIAIWNDTDEISHNRTVRCPYCNKYLKCKSEGMGRKNLFAVQWSALVQKYDEEVLVRYFCHTKDFQDDFHNPEIKSFEKFRTVHSVDKPRDFEWCRYKSTAEIRWCNFKDRSYGYCQPPETDVPRSAVLYNRNLLETVADTCMKYSAVDIYVNNVAETVHVSGGSRYMGQGGNILAKPWCIDWYFNSYRKAPYLEQLLKVGFYKIVQSVLEDRDCPEFNNGRTVMETLGINKLQFHMLRQIGNPSVKDVMILQYAGEIRQEDFYMLRHIHDKYRMDYPGKLKMGNNIFVGAMSDVFGAWVPDSWLDDIFAVCEKHPIHNYLFLTKNAERFVEYGVPSGLENMWYGTSITRENEVSRFNSLPAGCRTFVSIEPLLEDIEPEKHNVMFRQIDWIIIGAETGRNKDKVVPASDWVSKIVDEADRAGLPVFMKDSLTPIVGADKMRREYPAGLQRKAVSPKMEKKLFDSCVSCKVHLKKSMMVALSARSKRGEQPRQFGFMCKKCFSKFCTDYSIAVPDLVGLSDSGVVGKADE